MNTPTNRSDTYSLANGRACILLYPPDLTAEEVDGVTNWIQLIVWKLEQSVAMSAPKVPARPVEKWAATVPEAPVYAPCDLGPKPAPKVVVLDDPEADLPAVTPVPDAPYPAVPAVEESKPTRTRGPSFAEKGRENRIKVAKALAAGPLTSAQITERTGIPQGTLGGVITSGGSYGYGWWHKSDPRDRRSPFAITEKGRKALAEAGHDVPEVVDSKPDEVKTEVVEVESRRVGPTIRAGYSEDRDVLLKQPAPPAKAKPVDPDVQARDRGRCALIAEALVKLAVPLAAVSIAVESGLDMADVEKRLLAHPEWFERAGSASGGDKWRLTAAGRELANEAEAA